jgi:glycosyltransferase involved in cell wall biosynthesis
MKIGLIVPPFIPVPPLRYGGTELFIANLADGLRHLGHHPIVYTNGESTIACERRWLFPRSNWPIPTELHGSLEDINHTSWACHDAVGECDVIHLNNAPGLSFSRLYSTPFVYTLHHPQNDALSTYYSHFPDVHYVAISRAQALREAMPRMSVVHHGINPAQYPVGQGKREYLCSMGRIAPIKGIHNAIDVARRAGIPLKIAGEIQPLFRDYWEQVIRPQVDGRFIEYVGEADLAAKVELFGGALAMLFPIEWAEPFGLVMIEAMACGTPVLAFPRGAAPEVVCDGVSGWLSQEVDTMARQAATLDIPPARCRAWVEEHFSIERMAADYLHLYEQAISAGVHARRRAKVIPLDHWTEAAS